MLQHDDEWARGTGHVAYQERAALVRPWQERAPPNPEKVLFFHFFFHAWSHLSAVVTVDATVGSARSRIYVGE